MDKREMIERALGRFELDTGHYDGRGILELDLDALLGQAIVIECEVEHVDNPGTVDHGTWLWIPEIDHEGQLSDKEMIGTPGKALAIIVPLDKHNG